MMSTRIPKIHRSASAAKATLHSSTRRTSAVTATVKSPPAAISQTSAVAETVLPLSDDSDLDSLFEEQSDKENSSPVSAITGTVHDAPSSHSTSKKRKASGGVCSPVDEALPAKKAKLAPSPPASPGINKKRKASDNASPSADEALPAKKAKLSSPSPSEASSFVDSVGDLLFPTEPAPEVAPPKRIIRRKKRAMANPVRSDVRMGVRGTTAAGAGTISRPLNPLPAPPKATKATPAPTSKAPAPPAEDAALKKLLAANAKAAANRRETNVVDQHHIDKTTKAAMIKADNKPRSKAGPFKPKPAWRQDNPDLAEVDAMLRANRRESAVLDKRPSISNLSTGARNLVKVGSKGGVGARNMSSTTFEWKKNEDAQESMEMKRRKWAEHTARHIQEERRKKIERDAQLEQRAREIQAERKRCEREARERKERNRKQRKERIGDGLDELFLEEGL